MPEITVVVPTRDRPGGLRRCLARLSAQTVSERIEIVVVDDGSDDAESVAAAVTATPRTRLVRQPRRGPAAARNAGVRAARAPIVCFTDDDCEPASGWAEALAEALRAGAEVVAGRTEPADSANRYDVASQLITNYVARRASVPFAATNNVGSTARLLLELPFDDAYPDAAGEDRDWCRRLASAGQRIERRPDAAVVHHQELTATAFLRQQARYGRGAYRYHRGGPRRPLERPRFYADLLGRGFREGAVVGLLVALAQVATVAGYLGGWLAARRASR
ncbi:MAG TPA: glycosyltransferase [Gaiellaceae bacterium]|jgi:glycosyltransferase involved in cell wall biosynthesis|nr:glycosyltransferase [Gaiellaceae bacterium]